MNAALQADFLTVEEYLEGEEQSPIRHEYRDGKVYAMAGANRNHGRLAFNFAKALDTHLAGRRCQVSITDLKLHVASASADAFYYPDVMVSCDPRDTDPYANSYPKVIIEILSESTLRIDRIEKLDAYKQIETVEEYVLVAQDKMEATIFPRRSNWKPVVIRLATDSLRLESLQFSLPLADLYAGVNLPSK